ncbi:hypothetical protein HBI25_161150 [Parastagonospora nodorum]|nr:hypothetical protein HBH53_151660 [Parastagonospora nodorum]KAH3962502.1 hypothetical protein HBH52_224760 [Parastagonospora nodorum]KAH3965042.1 hypothetical protein HBH51_155750 [Parastagonospora nodorum]KAH4100972.1 hypothetical protein HBH46_147800 [Parastagonospora nodorum]KAH4161368.1 hypothetical protein HBH43_171510 [Parastagonospora nodorum]
MPKRSTGCFECRKRKVRCDETKPECNICLRRGTKCPGYRPTQSFILHRFDEQTDKPELIKEDESRYKYANHSPATQTTSPGSSQAVSRRPSAEEKPVDTTLPKRVSSIAADRIQHVGTFIALYLPTADGPALPPPSALMLALPTLPANSEVLLAAVDALSAAQLAVKNRNYPLINRSRSLYGTALSQMLKAIQDPATAVKDETLLSTYLLTLYEVFVGVTQGHGFFYHVQGLLHLLKQRGPSSFQSRLSLQIYHAIRYNSLSIGYHMRKASMLDSPEWLAVTVKAARFDPYVALLDVCIGIPRLLERTDDLAKAGNPPDQITSLIADSEALVAHAFTWLSNFEKNGPRYDMVPLSTFPTFLDICADRVFDPVFDFHYFGAGICYLIYWMSMLILQSNTFKLLRQHRHLELKQLMMWDRQLGGYADSICRSVPYNCRAVTGYAAKFGSLTPLVVARKYFEMKGAAKEKEAKWCEEVYVAARVPGLYSTPVPLEPLKGVKETVDGGTKKYI